VIDSVERIGSLLYISERPKGDEQWDLTVRVLHADPRKVDSGFPVCCRPTVLCPGFMERWGTCTNALVFPTSVGSEGL